MKLIKKYKWTLLISSMLILLPILFGVIMWNKLPEQMAVHWGIEGADGFAPRLATVILIPCLLLLTHWVCILITFKDNEKTGQGDRTLKIVLWIIPVLSLYSNGIIYATAFGMDIDISVITVIVIGLAFILLGNYMPKFSRNRTMGIKVYWALANDENWNATHRFGGKVWVIGGIILMLSAFVPSVAIPYIAAAVLLVISIAPIIYSYVYYRKQLKSGKITKESFNAEIKTSRFIRVISLILVAVIIVATICLMFTGNVSAKLGDEALEVRATYKNGITVRYEDIEKIEYRESITAGSRVNGFGSVRLLLGRFQNEELGDYTRYTYGGDRPCIILTVEERFIVIGLYDGEDTKALYDALVKKCSKIGEG